MGVHSYEGTKIHTERRPAASEMRMGVQQCSALQGQWINKSEVLAVDLGEDEQVLYLLSTTLLLSTRFLAVMMSLEQLCIVTMV